MKKAFSISLQDIVLNTHIKIPLLPDIRVSKIKLYLSGNKFNFLPRFYTVNFNETDMLVRLHYYILTFIQA